jgi:hypothetical protein
MQLRLAILMVTSAVLLFLIAPGGNADDWNRLTTAVFNEPVQVPGYVLPPGVYVFKLADVSGERNIVQIWNSDQTVLYATVMGFPEYIPEPPNENRFTLEGREGKAPKALKFWFQAGNAVGERFVYPKSVRTER